MGKQHGGLSRAGKVKNQTPKVEPKEKKKQLTGRARKRLLYNINNTKASNFTNKS